MRFILALCLFLLPNMAFAAGDKLAVIELFTGRGCTTSDKAETHFLDVANKYDGEILALTCHVTNFDQPTEEYDFPKEFCNKRITRYWQEGDLKDHKIPRIVMNGTFDTNGDYANILDSGVQMLKADFPTAPITLSLNGTELDVKMPNLTDHGEENQRADIWLFGYQKQAHTTRPGVDPMTNKPMTLPVKFVNIVRSLRKVAPWQGQAMHFGIKNVNALDVDGFAIIAQAENHGPILAAAKIEWP